MVFFRGLILVLLFQRFIDCAPVCTPTRRLMTNMTFILFAGRSLDQENTTTKVGRATIGQERNNEGCFDVLSLVSESAAIQPLNHVRDPVNDVLFFEVAAVALTSQRTIFHHAARSGSERRHTFG